MFQRAARLLLRSPRRWTRAASAAGGSAACTLSLAVRGSPFSRLTVCEEESPSGSDQQQQWDSSALIAAIEEGRHDAAINAVGKRRRYLHWEKLPPRIVLLRHGESEGNVNKLLYTSKGDSLLELTPKGIQAAEEAGARLRKLVGLEEIFVCLSPFERTQQTLLGLLKGGLPEKQIAVVHVETQIREQEFGNFQDPGLAAKVQAEAKMVGRFYYRRPNAESSADVLDRVTQFWDKLTSDGNDALLFSRSGSYGTCLVVTHGLTIRLLLMRAMSWSVETFEAVWNLGNCEHITLRKNMETLSYELCPEESYPARVPWATRQVWVVRKSSRASEATELRLRNLRGFVAAMGDEHCDAWPHLRSAIDDLEAERLRELSTPFTVVDYLNIPQPRTMQSEAVFSRLVEGHELDASPEELLARARAGTSLRLEDVDFIDWWGEGLSCRGKMLRRVLSTRHDCTENVK